MDIAQLLSDAVVGHDSQRPRSKQTTIGPSSIGGCQRRAFHILKETPATNLDIDKFSAIMGTYIHAGIAEAIRREDPFGDRFLIEHRLTHPLITGNVDLFDIKEGVVVDWKTTKMKSLRYFPSEQQVWQVQVYGWLLEEAGYKVNTVALVGIPRDGQMKDVRVHAVPYDRDVAIAALRWLESLRDLVASDGQAPEPQERRSYCALYCPYFDETGLIGCPSTQK